MKKQTSDVLDMSAEPSARGKVRRHYLKWRGAQGLPVRCDNPACNFHTSPLEWNGRPLPLTLDHRSGNARDNRPENLRLLCPNCDSQNDLTRGGANAGRIKLFPDGSYTADKGNGKSDAYLKAKSLGNVVKFGTPTLLLADPTTEGEGTESAPPDTKVGDAA